MNNDMQKKIAKLPSKTGVYLFLDKKSKVLYIGKAKHLKNRVKSYFSNNKDTRPQIPILVTKIHEVQFILTANEREALILENNLIKKNKPDYNICLKDDKTYQSLSINLSEKYPKIQIVRKYQKNEKILYFGPYLRVGEIRKSLRNLLHFFMIRDCSETEFKRRTKQKKACLKYQMNQCMAPCIEKITKEEYQKNIENVVMFLKGKNTHVLNSQNQKIKKLSQEMKFEEAALILKKTEGMKKLIDQKTIVSRIYGNIDIIGYHQKDTNIMFQVLIIRAGRLISHDNEYFSNVLGTTKELLSSFLEQYYYDTFRIPDKIVIPASCKNKQILQSILSNKKGKKCLITIPKRGKLLDLSKMATFNAKSKFEISTNKRKQTDQFQTKLKKIFKTDKEINTIECFDISHISGKDIVGVKVSYTNGQFEKQNYRKYIIKQENKGDDYKSMYEILTRRLKRGEQEQNLPDLLLIDGGIAHLGIASRVIKELNLKMQIAAISKETHSKSSKDKVYIANRINPLNLKNNDTVLLTLMKIRDETHRFALSFHKQKRQKRIMKN